MPTAPAKSKRRWLLPAVAVAILAIGVIVGLVIGNSSDGTDATKPRPTHPSTSSTTAATTTTTAPAVTTTLGVPVPASAAGALFQALPPPVLQSIKGPDTDCHALGDTGWTVDRCDTFTRAAAGGTDRTVIIVESKPSGGVGAARRAVIARWSQGKGGWLVDLLAKDDTGSQFASITYVAKDLTGDGTNELVVGVRMQGSGSILSLDVVGSLFDGPAVVAHRELSHGQAAVAATGITDWDAKYEGGAPNCCPSYFQQAVVRWNGSAWVVSNGPHVANAGSGDF